MTAYSKPNDEEPYSYIGHFKFFDKLQLESEKR
jgi:hypothetical protein